MSMESWELAFWEMQEEFKMEALKKMTAEQLAKIADLVSEEMVSRVGFDVSGHTSEELDAIADDMETLKGAFDELEAAASQGWTEAMQTLEDVSDERAELREKARYGRSAWHRDREAIEERQQASEDRRQQEGR